MERGDNERNETCREIGGKNMSKKTRKINERIGGKESKYRRPLEKGK